MYELYILTKSGQSHWAKTTEAALEIFRDEIDNDACHDFIEVHCEGNDHVIAINRKEVEVFTYKLVEEDE